MLVDPDLDEIVNGERGMLRGVDACIHAQCLVSAVGLIYSTIDAVSALNRPAADRYTKRSVFLEWVNTYIKPETMLSCSAEDLYGARCGVLHLYGPDSTLRRQGQAKALIYTWKAGPAPHRRLASDTIILCVEQLRDVVKDAVNQFLGEVERDCNLKNRVQGHSAELLCYKPSKPVKIFVAA